LFQNLIASDTVRDPDATSLRDFEIGKNLGTTMEIVSGLKPEDRVILNQSDSLATGMRVRIEVQPEL
jgi:hypothetical protein